MISTIKSKTSYKLKTCEMHTCGGAVRILELIEPEIKFPENSNILEKRNYLSENYDFIRQMLMMEPRGHKEMFGTILTEPNKNSGSDFGILFMDNKEYFSMCGHITIAVGRYLLEKRLIKPIFPETIVKLDCPCGQLEISVEFEGNKVGNTKFLSIPAFVQSFDYEIYVPQLDKNIKCDIVYGGNYFAIVSADEIGIDFDNDSPLNIIKNGIYLLKILNEKFKSFHVITKDPESVHGVLIKDYVNNSHVIKEVCVYGESCFDRSPCGSGTTAILAGEYFRKNIQLFQSRITQNAFIGENSNFHGTPIKEEYITVNDIQISCIRIQISGRGYFIGESTFTYEEDDFFKFGFAI